MALRAFEVSDWGFVRFVGPDAKTFLQGLITADARALAPGVMLPACVLTPKGLLVADCELYEESPVSVLAVTRPAAVVGFLKTFEKMVRLSNSEMKVLRATTAWLVFGAGFDKGFPWSRCGEPARLLMGSDPPAEADLLSADEFHALRVAAGFPWYGVDMNEDSLPLEARQERGISLDKGCFMGQETVSRLARVGHVNKILVGLRFANEIPAVGAALTRDDSATGSITSVAGSVGLGTVKIGDMKPGTALKAGDVSVEVRPVANWPAPYGVR